MTTGFAALRRNDDRRVVLDDPVHHFLQPRAGIGVGENVHGGCTDFCTERNRPDQFLRLR
jgi:hypothetical protein